MCLLISRTALVPSLVLESSEGGVTWQEGQLLHVSDTQSSASETEAPWALEDTSQVSEARLQVSPEISVRPRKMDPKCCCPAAPALALPPNPVSSLRTPLGSGQDYFRSSFSILWTLGRAGKFRMENKISTVWVLPTPF